MHTAVSVTEVEPLDATVAAEVAAVHEQSAVAAYAHIFDAPFPRDETQQRWAVYSGRIALARRADQTIGFVAWHEDELDALYVLPAAAGTGAGSALMKIAAGVTHLWVLEENLHARRFYEKRGWRASTRRRSIWGNTHELKYHRG